MRSRALIVLRGILGPMALVYLVAALIQDWREARSAILPSTETALLSGGVLLLASGAAVASWVVLFERGESRRALAYNFTVAQFAKYIPGGVWQLIGQVGYASAAGATLARASVALPVHLAIQVAAAGTLAVPTFFFPSSGTRSLRLGSLGFGLSLVFLCRPLVVFAIANAGRLGLKRVTAADVPSQRAMLRAYLLASVTIFSSGLAFALLLSSFTPGLSVPALASAFGVAWLAGFAAILVPAGLGVRELVLVALVPASAMSVIPASVVHRILSMVAEIAVAIGARGRR